MTLHLLPHIYCVCKLSPSSQIVEALMNEDFVAAVRTREDLSIICRAEITPAKCIDRKDGFRCLKVEGPLDFALTGVMSSVLVPLADAKISIFAISTFDTDYVLVQQTDLSRAVDALRCAGHGVID